MSRMKKEYDGEYRSRNNIYCTDSELAEIRKYLKNKALSLCTKREADNENNSVHTHKSLRDKEQRVCTKCLVTKEEYESLEQAMVLFFYEYGRRDDLNSYVEQIMDKMDNDSVNRAWEFVSEHFEKDS